MRIKSHHITRHFFVATASAIAITACLSGAWAGQASKSYQIAEKPLAEALMEFGVQSGLVVVAPSNLTAGKKTHPVQGTMAPDRALRQMLEGSGLRYIEGEDGSIAIKKDVSALQDSNAVHLAQLTGANSSQLASDGQSVASDDMKDEQAPSAADQKSVLEQVTVIGAKRKFAPTDSSASTKINMSVLDTPQSLSILSSELMSIVGVNSVNSAAALAPGVVDREGEIPIYVGIVARGFSVDAGNGNKINGMSYQSNGGPIDFGIAERFEIVRGPASIIYGQADYGATTNLTLKAPKAKRAFAGELGYGIDGSYRAMVDVTGSLTEDEHLRGRLIVIYDDVKTPQDFAFMKTTTVAPSISWDVMENTTLDVNFFHGARDTRRANGFTLMEDSVTHELSIPDVSRKAFIGASFNNNRADMDFGLAKLTHDFGNTWVLTATGSWNKITNDVHDARLFDRVSENGTQGLHDLHVIQGTKDIAGDLTLVGDFKALGQSHTLMLNGFYRKHDDNYIGACCTVVGQMNIFDPDPTIYSSSYSYFDSLDMDHQPQGIAFSQHFVSKETAFSGLLLLHPVDRMSVMLGLRYSEFKTIATDFYDRSISFQSPDEFNAHATNRRVGVVYEVMDKVNVYGSYSTGTIFNTSITFDGDSLPAETGVQWEFGAKAALLDEKLTISAAAFQIKRNNVATGDPDHPNTPFSIVIDGQTHKGIELEAIGEPIPGWNILSSYSYLDVSITNAPDPAMIGQQRASAPHNLVKLYTTYQLLNGPLHGLSLGGGMFYVGKRDVDNVGTFKLPAYTRFDLRLGYDALENISFSVNAINITDKKIYVAQNESSGGAIDYQNRRTVMFHVNFKY